MNGADLVEHLTKREAVILACISGVKLAPSIGHGPQCIAREVVELADYILAEAAAPGGAERLLLERHPPAVAGRIETKDGF